VVDQDQVVEEEVMKDVFGDHVRWKRVSKTLFSGHMGRRRGDVKFLIWIGRKGHSLCRDRGGWLWGKTGEARLCLICNHLHG
jgi:hypothetical protein